MMSTPSLLKPANKPKGAYSTPFWWFLFMLDTVILSWCFQAFKYFTLYPTVLPGLAFIGFIALFVSCTLLLVYDSYVKERSQGKVKHPIRLFEFFASPKQNKPLVKSVNQ